MNQKNDNVNASHGAGGEKQFTAKQGQYLAFIHAYMQINRRAPAEADMQRYFLVTPPTVHQMIKTLERAEFLQRQPGVARSIKLLIDPGRLPALKHDQTKPS
jgi:DNA-binding MarR family transcriptional regulator